MELSYPIFFWEKWAENEYWYRYEDDNFKAYLSSYKRLSLFDRSEIQLTLKSCDCILYFYLENDYWLHVRTNYCKLHRMIPII